MTAVHVDLGEARHRWHGLLASLGLPAKALRNRHGPCPMCGGKDRFRFDDKDGRGTWYCTHCGAGDGATLAMRFLGVDFRAMIERVGPMIGVTPIRKTRERRMDEAERKRLLNEMWGSAKPIAVGDIVDLYLRSRCLSPPWSPELRTGRYEDGEMLLARVRDAAGAPCTLHRTFLTPEGKKRSGEARKLMPGPLPEGAAVWLQHPGIEIGIAEGIETALSAWKLFGIPCFAALSAEGLKRWSPPPRVEIVHIFGDNDRNFVGQAAAYEVARRLMGTKEGPSAVVHLPGQSGQDWNDVLTQGRALAA